MRTVGDVVQIVRSLLGDTRGQWVTLAYLLPILDITYGDIVLNLKNASGKNLMAVVPILGVPAGTTSLYPWQQATAKPGTPVEKMNPPPLLQGLTDVTEIWVKPAGAATYQYAQIFNRARLPHSVPNVNSSQAYLQGMYWTMMGNRLLISPVGEDLDIEVTGRFNPQALSSEDNILTAHEDVWIPLAYQAAATAGIERSNPAILQGYATKAIASTDNLIAEIMRGEQGEPHRFQKISRDSGDGYALWFWGV